MRKSALFAAFLCMLFCFSGCSTGARERGLDSSQNQETRGSDSMQSEQSTNGAYTLNTPITDVINDPVFGTYGRLIFPVDSGYYSGDTLEDLSLTWYQNIDPNKTVEITNYLKSHAQGGETVFYDIYTEEEKAADPEKENTGLFFFKGNPGARFAVCNAGGGFAYVGAMQDSSPMRWNFPKWDIMLLL